MSKSLAELLAAKKEPTSVESISQPEQSFSDIKNSLGNFANVREQVTPAVTVTETPSSQVPPAVSSLTKGVDVLELGNINLDTIQTSTPSFFGENKSPEFSTPEQKEKYEQEQLQQFKQAILQIKNSLDNKELVTDAIRFVYAHIREHPFLKDLIEPADMGTMVAGLRESYGTVIAKKQERSSKRASNKKEVDDIVGMLDFKL